MALRTIGSGAICLTGLLGLVFHVCSTVSRTTADDPKSFAKEYRKAVLAWTLVFLAFAAGLNLLDRFGLVEMSVFRSAGLVRPKGENHGLQSVQQTDTG